MVGGAHQAVASAGTRCCNWKGLPVLLKQYWGLLQTPEKPRVRRLRSWLQSILRRLLLQLESPCCALEIQHSLPFSLKGPKLVQCYVPRYSLHHLQYSNTLQTFMISLSATPLSLGKSSCPHLRGGERRHRQIKWLAQRQQSWNWSQDSSDPVHPLPTMLSFHTGAFCKARSAQTPNEFSFQWVGGAQEPVRARYVSLKGGRS